MILTALIAALEAAFNRWLQLDPDALPRITALQGRIIAVHITGLDLKVFFIPTSSGVTISMDYQTDPDVTISGSAMALSKLALSEDASKALLESGVKIEGDLRTGQRFSEILKEVDIEWEELLSQVVGDIVAHQMGETARSTQGWLKDTAQAMRLNTREYLQEESRVLPADAELNYYLDAVDTLRADTDRLAARVQRLTTQADVE
ncbi:MAG: SCP2 sterol-binding domain-containing protein [Thiofilum sp.]|uniref:ubiquinone biosynthesis accessory factor UbiJ n=1 Tax=Thiofilum sp. TaxID=2212733 RepID=UPI0025E9703C|nr:SCP2 sterol-binding domain-containing protein [Thiofilum sp.]MBK8452318.1 SCP2 sterol-binding domain-containing protein [Thiofilum sp.]